MTPPLRRYHLGFRIILMFCMFFVNMSVVSLLALLISQKIFGLENADHLIEGVLNTENEISAFLFLQGFTALGSFALTAMMFAVLESGEFLHHLRLKSYPAIKLLLLGIASVIVVQLFVEFLVSLNQRISLPSSFQFLYDYQKKAEEITNAMMNFKDFGHFIVVAIVMAVIPAISEEFFFRGLLLGDLLKGKVHPAIAITATGFLFSMSHLEFDNTLAIWVLGTFLGFLYYVSGSLWLPIAVHFTNNFLAVLLKYLFNLGMITEDFAEARTPLYATLISLGLFAFFIFLFIKWKNPASFAEAEEPEPYNENLSA